jgi:hypothetical protein
MTPEPTPHHDALVAAAKAFAATRAARRMLDTSGRLGADAVGRADPISGARRASRKAQAAMEDAAQQLEKARDRWGALLRGLAGDLDLSPEALVELVEATALEMALADATQALDVAVAAARSAKDPATATVQAITAAAKRLRARG